MEQLQKRSILKDDFDRKLIELVKANESLYNKSCKAYRNKEARQNKWKKIASILKRKDTDCEKRWITLRERYGRELRRRNRMSKEDLSIYHSWIYFDEMSFLKQHIISRNSSAAIPTLNSHEKQTPEYESESDSKDNPEIIEFVNDINPDEIQQYDEKTSDVENEQKFDVTHGSSHDIKEEEMFDEVDEEMNEIIKDDFDRQLIELVKANEFLYNKSCKAHRNMEARRNKWKKIASILKRKDTDCEKRWITLRDRYSRELRKLNRMSKNDSDTYHNHPWTYFDEMSFLKQHIISRNSSATNSTSSVQKIQTTEYESENDSKDNPEIIEFVNDINPHEIQQYDDKTSDAEYEQKFEVTHGSSHDIKKEEILEKVHEQMNEIIKDINQTVALHTNILKIRLNRSEYENFGILVSETLSQLTVPNRIKAKAHIIQYLAKLHLDQLAFE